ncbi:hypothetical protein N7454_009842 [Penicillium verhagenii]|nr:hypothetical protein N7454_009842 [Penicillium verhagenii]
MGEFFHNTEEELSPSDMTFSVYNLTDVDGSHSTLSINHEASRLTHATQGIPMTRLDGFPLMNADPFSTHQSSRRDSQYQESGDDQVSPKQSSEVESLHSISDGLSKFQQKDVWGSAPYMPRYDRPSLPETKFFPATGVHPPIPLFHHTLAYDTLAGSSDGTCLGGNLANLITDGGDIASEETETFRFRTILQAPTAMINEGGDPPLSYLNKGQVYYLTVLDSTPPQKIDKAATYRTFVRVSFDQEQARSNSAAFWQLWKEGRGIPQDHQQEETPYAVEYVGGDSFQFQVEQKNFDGFCVTWKMNSVTGFNSCHIPLCFNFLSTDFTRSKGVRGSPVRLCSKTEELTTFDEPVISSEPEVCFCKVQVFRDHGAERKLSNDHSNLMRGIEKLKHRISNAELGWSSRKRKRGRPVAKNLKKLRQDDVSEQLNQAGLRSKLFGLEKMALSSHSRTVLTLRGDKDDDPDLHPIHLLEDENGSKTVPIKNGMDTSTRMDEWEIVTPPNSNHSDTETPAIPQMVADDDLSPGFIKVNRIDFFDQGVTSRHRNSGKKLTLLTQLVACFYIRLLEDDLQEYYRAIYLSERTIEELAKKISEKYDIESLDLFNVFYINENNLKIMVDDDFVHQMPEGQHMEIELRRAKTSSGNSEDICETWLLY